MARIIPFSAIQFSAHEEYKNLLHVDKNGNKTPMKRFLAAVSSKTEYQNLAAVLVKTYQENGFKALYRGCYPSLLGIVPYGGSSWFVLETLKIVYHERTGQKVNPFIHFIFGGIAGAAGQGLTYPLDIVRRRMQTGRISHDQRIIVSLREIWKNEGFKRGLYKGLSMNWIKGPVSAGISYTTYHYLFDFLKTIS
uniref:Mitochondrial carrier protein n=1 Tax=Panagrolaimus sp. ES5 TaxID=591445 RepID=A0AC34FLW4_9BILA